MAEILGGERGKSSEMSSFEKRQNRVGYSSRCICCII